MPSWTEIRTDLLARYAALESDADFLAVRLTAGGRSQTVMITHHEGDRGPSWIGVESGLGTISPEALAVAIDYVGFPENGGVGLGRLDDFLVMRWTTTVEGATIEHVATMVDGVAGHADRLEAHLTGGSDQF